MRHRSITSPPINCINWIEAFAFCAWDGGFLPTDAEWNYAAAGGSQQRAYPWSNPPSSQSIACSQANTISCVDAVTRVGTLSPAGHGAWGHADLAGNVLEWMIDYYGPYVNPCDDCAQLTTSTFRMFRRGHFADGPQYARVPYSSGDAPTLRAIRCARRP